MTSNPGFRSGQIAIVSIALVGLVFFGGMELMKRRLHKPIASPIASVVILPTKVVGTADVAYLTDGVPGTLSTLLAQVPGLDTKNADLSHAGAALTSVINIAYGSVTLDLQLVNPATHDMLWNKQILGKLTDYNELLRQAADGVAHALQPASPSISTRGLAINSEAELERRQGEYYFARFDQLHEDADLKTAVAACKYALQLDPALSCHGKSDVMIPSR